MAHYYLIGCGGIGGWLANALVKTLKNTDHLHLVDGDTIEKHNLDRQLFTSDDIGSKKVHALFERLGDGARCEINTYSEYLGQHREVDFVAGRRSWVLVGTDNHPARMEALKICDENRMNFISAANGYEDAEAFFYNPAWKESPMDPRVYYPEMATDTTDDPLSPPCTGEVLETTPQLAIANMCAASYAMWLLWFWRERHPKLETASPETKSTFPIHVSSTAGRMRVKTMGDFTTT